MPNEHGTLETDAVLVRDLSREDLPRVVKIDALRSGRTRAEYYERKLQEALGSTPRISLAAEVDGSVVGFIIGRLYYGEFGIPEPTAVIDSLGVDPEFAKQRVGSALIQQLIMNMRTFGIESIRTEVEWDAHELVAFLARHEFKPAPRLCLELNLSDEPKR